jgi:hypothetical protein
VEGRLALYGKNEVTASEREGCRLLAWREMAGVSLTAAFVTLF